MPEDGSDRLVYAFTRSGAAASELAVFSELNSLPSNAVVLAVDFTQTGASISPNPRSLSIRLQPGGITTTLPIDPISDRTVEPDKDIYLQLVADPAYGLVTTAFVLARILNDDLSPYTQGLNTINSVNLGISGQGYAICNGSGAPLQIT